MAADAATLARIKRTGMGAMSPAVGLAALAAALATMSAAASQRPVLTAMPVVWTVLLKGRTVPFFFEEFKPAQAPAQLPAVSTVPAVAHKPASTQPARAAAELEALAGQVCRAATLSFPSRQVKHTHPACSCTCCSACMFAPGEGSTRLKPFLLQT